MGTGMASIGEQATAHAVGNPGKPASRLDVGQRAREGFMARRHLDSGGCSACWEGGGPRDLSRPRACVSWRCRRRGGSSRGVLGEIDRQTRRRWDDLV